MAGQNQYTFDFVLNAMLNGGFSSTFSKAQQEFVRLGAEIKNLQAIQRDVKSYEKQQAAVQNTTGKLENLKKQYELVQKEINETTGSTSALEREKLKLEQRINATEAALEKQKQKLDETKGRLDEAGISTDNLAAADGSLTEKIKELTEEQKKAAEGAGEFKNAGVEAIDALAGAVAAAGIAEAIGKVKDAWLECVEVAADFEQAMSAVEAIAEADTQEMAALTAEAKELGKTTVFTAQQSANAMEYMAMAGWDAQEMLNGMSGVVTLAAAAGEDLAQVSDIVTDNLTAFGLRASDTAHFADVLAAAAANSNTNISIMGETFKSSSAVAGALGYSVEDVAVAVGLMANNAVKGSRAGTALRNIFNGLLKGMTLTSEAFGEIEYSAVNTDGTMKGLMETVNDLRGYFDQMTEAEKVNNAMTIAGMRGYNGLLAILNATDEDFQSLYNSINNCNGAAQRMASVKLDNLNGDITLANSAMEALQATIGEQFNPELRELTQLKTEVLNGLNQFIKDNPELVKGVMAGGAAFLGLGTAIVGVNAAIQIFRKLELASLFTGAGGILLGAAAAASAIAGVGIALAEMQNQARKAYQEQLDELEEFQQESDAVLARYESMEQSSKKAYETMEQETAEISSLIGELERLSSTSEDAAKNQDAIRAIVDQLNRSLPELGMSYSDVQGGADGYIERLREVATAQADAMKREQDYQDYVNSISIKDALERDVEIARAKRDEAQTTYDEARRRYNEAVKLWQNSDPITFMLNTKDEAAAVDVAKEALEGYQDELDKATKAAGENQEKINGLEDAWRNYAEEQGEAVTAQEEVTEAIAGTMTAVDELTQAYADAYEEAKESFEGQFELFDEAETDAEATVEAAQKALDSQLAYWKNYASNIAALRELSAEDLGTTKENYEAMMEYVRTGTPEAAGLAADMVKAVNDGNTQALTDLAETIGEIAKTQEQAEADVADWKSGLSEQMGDLVEEFGEDVDSLNMGKEAAEAAYNTIQSYIDKADEMLPDVLAAYRRLAYAAQTAMGVPLAPYAATTGIPALPKPRDMMEKATFGLRGYATGTENAPPGWAWVGEDGPELLRMKGGEQVLPATVSQQVAQSYTEYKQYTEGTGVTNPRPALEVTGSTYTVSGAGKVEMHFHIEAGATPETVDAWEDYARRGELKAVVLEVMEEAEADTRRRVLV